MNFRPGSVTIAGCGTQPLVGGTVTCTTSALLAGTQTIGAAYSGDANNAVSSGTCCPRR